VTTFDLAALGRNVRRIRAARGLTLKSLEQVAEVSATHVSEIERGKTTPTVRALEQIAGALGITVTRLLEIDVEERVRVVRAPNRRLLAMDDGALALSPLSSTHGRHETSFFTLTLEPGRASDPAPERGMGEDVILVLAGRLDVESDREITRLESGDALHVRAAGGPRLSNPGTVAARALWFTRPRIVL
jgi:transcriptional regulator with XRE-family HTH domain